MLASKFLLMQKRITRSPFKSTEKTLHSLTKGLKQLASARTASAIRSTNSPLRLHTPLLTNYFTTSTEKTRATLLQRATHLDQKPPINIDEDIKDFLNLITTSLNSHQNGDITLKQIKERLNSYNMNEMWELGQKVCSLHYKGMYEGIVAKDILDNGNIVLVNGVETAPTSGYGSVIRGYSGKNLIGGNLRTVDTIIASIYAKALGALHGYKDPIGAFVTTGSEAIGVALDAIDRKHNDKVLRVRVDIGFNGRILHNRDEDIEYDSNRRIVSISSEKELETIMHHVSQNDHYTLPNGVILPVELVVFTQEEVSGEKTGGKRLTNYSEVRTRLKAMHPEIFKDVRDDVQWGLKYTTEDQFIPDPSEPPSTYTVLSKAFFDGTGNAIIIGERCDIEALDGLAGGSGSMKPVAMKAFVNTLAWASTDAYFLRLVQMNDTLIKTCFPDNHNECCVVKNTGLMNRVIFQNPTDREQAIKILNQFNKKHILPDADKLKDIIDDIAKKLEGVIEPLSESDKIAIEQELLNGYVVLLQPAGDDKTLRFFTVEQDKRETVKRATFLQYALKEIAKQLKELK